MPHCRTRLIFNDGTLGRVRARPLRFLLKFSWKQICSLSIEVAFSSDSE